MAKASFQPMIMTRSAMPRPTIAPPPTGSGANPQTVTSLGLKDALLGAIIGFGTGGPAGAVAGAATGLLGPSGPTDNGPSDLAFPGSFAGTRCDPPAFRVGNRCVDPGAALPGGDPFITPVAPEVGTFGTELQPIQGMYGVGAVPRTITRQVRQCPTGFVLGDDGVCYRGLARSRRAWDPGMKPLMTGGDRRAIRRAERVAKALVREEKRIKRTARELAKVG